MGGFSQRSGPTSPWNPIPVVATFPTAKCNSRIETIPCQSNKTQYVVKQVAKSRMLLIYNNFFLKFAHYVPSLTDAFIFWMFHLLFWRREAEKLALSFFFFLSRLHKILHKILWKLYKMFWKPAGRSSGSFFTFNLGLQGSGIISFKKKIKGSKD